MMSKSDKEELAADRRRTANMLGPRVSVQGINQSGDRFYRPSPSPSRRRPAGDGVPSARPEPARGRVAHLGQRGAGAAQRRCRGRGPSIYDNFKYFQQAGLDDYAFMKRCSSVEDLRDALRESGLRAAERLHLGERVGDQQGATRAHHDADP